MTNKGEAPGQVDEVATLLPSGRRPTCLPNNKFEPTIEQLVAENASWQKWKRVEKPTQPSRPSRPAMRYLSKMFTYFIFLLKLPFEAHFLQSRNVSRARQVASIDDMSLQCVHLLYS